VLPRPPSATGSRAVFVLGAYPSGFHVAWWLPEHEDRPTPDAKALIVDNALLREWPSWSTTATPRTSPARVPGPTDDPRLWGLHRRPLPGPQRADFDGPAQGRIPER
jgi:hypothetical protein